MLIMLIHFGGSLWNAQWDLTLLTLLTFPMWEAKMLLPGEMFIILHPCFEKMLLAGEMLIMLILLDPIWQSLGKSPTGFKLIIILRFPLSEAKKASGRGNVNRVNNVRSLFLKETGFGKGNVNNVNNNVQSYSGLFGKCRIGFNIINISLPEVFLLPQGK